MPCPDRLSLWSREVSTAFAQLSKPQAWGLMLWSAGIALSGVAGITQISALLALQTSCGSAARTPLELCGAWSFGGAGCLVQRRGLALWQIADRSLAEDHHSSQKTSEPFGIASAGTQTRVQAPGPGTSAGCSLIASKKPILESGACPRPVPIPAPAATPLPASPRLLPPHRPRVHRI